MLKVRKGARDDAAAMADVLRRSIVQLRRGSSERPCGERQAAGAAAYESFTAWRKAGA